MMDVFGWFSMEKRDDWLTNMAADQKSTFLAPFFGPKPTKTSYSQLTVTIYSDKYPEKYKLHNVQSTL